MEVADSTEYLTYRIKSVSLGTATRLPPALTVEITDREAKIHTTLGEVVTVSRAEFVSLVRRILRENDRDLKQF
jgi:hypothetical protein